MDKEEFESLQSKEWHIGICHSIRPSHSTVRAGAPDCLPPMQLSPLVCTRVQTVQYTARQVTGSPSMAVDVCDVAYGPLNCSHLWSCVSSFAGLPLCRRRA